MAKYTAPSSKIASAATKASASSLKRIVTKSLSKFKTNKTSKTLPTTCIDSPKPTSTVYKNPNDSEHTLTDTPQPQRSRIRNIFKKWRGSSKKQTIAIEAAMDTDEVEDMSDEDADEQTLCDKFMDGVSVYMVEDKMAELEIIDLTGDDNMLEDHPSAQLLATSVTISLAELTLSVPEDATMMTPSMKQLSIEDDIEMEATDALSDAESVEVTMAVDLDRELDILSAKLAAFEITDGISWRWSAWMQEDHMPCPLVDVDMELEVELIVGTKEPMELEIEIIAVTEDPMDCSADGAVDLEDEDSTVDSDVEMCSPTVASRSPSLAAGVRMDCRPDPYRVHECENLLCACCYLPPFKRNPDFDFDMDDDSKKKHKQRKQRPPPQETFCGVAIDDILQPKKARLPATRRRVFGPYDLSRRRPTIL
ncbi:hypothetical protein EIP86_008979 [Pleurotus ostreatoroseus]|nr:hypothetical protein EIP86_008979 [Pleurotus ostreatoroseus]